MGVIRLNRDSRKLFIEQKTLQPLRVHSSFLAKWGANPLRLQFIPQIGGNSPTFESHLLVKLADDIMDVAPIPLLGDFTYQGGCVSHVLFFHLAS